MNLDRIKILLGIDGEEANSKIGAIVQITEERLRLFLGGLEEIPEALRYIVDEVSIQRFNRIGSEGLSSHSVEGESMAWSDNDFKPYMDDINRYLESEQNDERNGRGLIRFI